MARRCLLRLAVVFISTALLSPVSISAQTFYGSIVGQLRIPRGAWFRAHPLRLPILLPMNAEPPQPARRVTIDL